MTNLAGAVALAGVFVTGLTVGSLVQNALAVPVNGQFETEVNLNWKDGTYVHFMNIDKSRGSISVACTPTESYAYRDAKRGGIYLLSGGAILITNDQENAPDDPHQKGSFIKVTCDKASPNRGGAMFTLK
jgi:hypothetical protein